MEPRKIPTLYAHRGVSVEFDENTIEAFAAAGSRGADGVELDVRRTADARLAVHHDPRLADGRAIVSLAAGDLPASVPLLDAALDACAGRRVNIEIKNIPGEPDFDESGSVARSVAALVRERELLSSVIVSSFNFADLTTLREADTDLATGWLVLELFDLDAMLTHLVDGHHQALHPQAAKVTPELVSAAHDRSLLVNAWTVDEPRDLVALAELGIDGIVTNDPATARLTMGQWARSPA